MSEHVAYCTNAACSIHMPLPDNPQGATGLDVLARWPAPWRAEPRRASDYATLQPIGVTLDRDVAEFIAAAVNRLAGAAAPTPAEPLDVYIGPIQHDPQMCKCWCGACEAAATPERGGSHE